MNNNILKLTQRDSISTTFKKSPYSNCEGFLHFHLKVSVPANQKRCLTTCECDIVHIEKGFSLVCEKMVWIEQRILLKVAILMWTEKYQ